MGVRKGEKDPSHPFMKIVRILGVAIGLGIVAYLLQEVGWPSIRHSLGMLRWGYLPVLAYPISWMLLNTAGWRSAMHAQYQKLPLIHLARIRVAGETFNSLLPSGYVGGEPLKARLVSQDMPVAEAVSSVLIAKAAQSIGLVLFVGIGLTLGTRQGHVGATKSSTLISLLCLSIGIGLFTFLLTRRSFSRVGRWLHSVTKNAWLQKQEERLIALDNSIGAFYREGKTQFLKSVVWHCAGWLAGALEVALIFFLLGHPINWQAAWFIGAMAQLASVIGLLVPAGVGLYEGGHYMAASMLGLPPALGLSVSLIRRVREVFWDGFGLYFFWKLSATLGKKRLEP